MSAEDLKNAIESDDSMWNHYLSLPGGVSDTIEQIRHDIISLIEQERKAAVEEYKLENYKAEMIGRAPATPSSNKKQLIIDLTKAALTGLCANQRAWEEYSWNMTIDRTINLAIDAAEKLDKLEL